MIPIAAYMDEREIDHILGAAQDEHRAFVYHTLANFNIPPT